MGSHFIFWIQFFVWVTDLFGVALSYENRRQTALKNMYWTHVPDTEYHLPWEILGDSHIAVCHHPELTPKGFQCTLSLLSLPLPA